MPVAWTSPLPELFWAAAVLAALLVSLRESRRSGLSARSMYWAVTSSVLAGFWGAHLLSLLVHGWDGGLAGLLQFAQGGKSLYGGLLLGGLAAALFFHYSRLPVLVYADAAMPALALGYAIGRVGCFLNGDDYGTVTRVPWAVIYPRGTEAYHAHLLRGWIWARDAWSLPVHPVQLYLALLGAALFLLLQNWRPRRPGSRLCVYLVIYGIGRFVLEYFRGDFQAVFGPFSLPQVFSAAFVATGAALGWFRVLGRHGNRYAAAPQPFGEAARLAAP